MTGFDEKFALLKKVRADLSENRKNSNAKTSVKETTADLAAYVLDFVKGSNYAYRPAMALAA